MFEPEIKEADGGILVTLFKDSLTEELLRKLGLNERQILAITYLKQHPTNTNNVYQEICDTSERTALRDLNQLIDLNLLNENSNYINDTSKGKNTHTFRVRIDNFMASIDREKMLCLYEVLGSMGIGRDLIYYCSFMS